MPTPTQLDPEFLTPAADGLATGTAGIAQRAATAIEDKRDALARGLDSAAAGIQAIADDLPGGAKVVEAMQGFRRMWMETDFSAEAASAKLGTPILVIGGRLDLPFYSEEAFKQSFGVWYPNVGFRYIADAGHYLPIETPAFLASLIEEFLRANS